MKAVETLWTTNQEESVELEQIVERTAEKALSTLVAAESRQLQSFMNQVKEELAAHTTEVCMPTLYATR